MGVRQRKELLFADKLKVCDWLRANKDKLLEQRPAYTELASELTQILNLGVTDHVLIRLLESLDMKWESRINPKRIPAEVEKRVCQLEQEVAVLKAQLETGLESIASLLPSIMRLTDRVDFLEISLGVAKKKFCVSPLSGALADAKVEKKDGQHP
jgi:hypothetical protein